MMKRYGGTTTFSAPKLRELFDYAEMARKSRETMKRNKSYLISKEEKLFGVYLSKFGQVEQYVIVNKRWPIDFYLKDHKVYVQYDGVYWHGLDRPIEIIAEHRTKRDKAIHMKWLIDRKQEAWFLENNFTLIRVPSTTFNKKLMTCSFFEDKIESILSSLQHQPIDVQHDEHLFQMDVNRMYSNADTTSLKEPTS